MNVTRFLPKFLGRHSLDGTNYALQHGIGTDLRLVSGPCPWQEEIKAALRSTAFAALGHYRSPSQDPELLSLIAAREGLDPGCIWLTAGADNAIEFVLERFLADGGKLGVVSPNFPRFAIVGSSLARVEVEYCADLNDFTSAPAVLAVCTPCNPTTRELDEEQVRAGLRRFPDTLFCIDAVFSWYATWDPSALCRDFDNVVVLKSYSKIGLAGLRLGYVLAAPSVIAEIRLGRSPFSVPAVSQAIALEVERAIGRVALIHEELAIESAWLSGQLGASFHRSARVPFYVLRTAIDSSDAARALSEHSVLVVDGAKFHGMEANSLRVAIGTHEENLELVRVVALLGLIA